MNSIVWPIFNESFSEKEVYGSRKQCPRPTGKDRNMFLKIKIKTQNADVEMQTQYPNGYLAYFLPAYFCYYSWAPLYFQQKSFQF